MNRKLAHRGSLVALFGALAFASPAPAAVREISAAPVPETKTIRPTRPVAVEGGRVTLAPKNAQGAKPGPAAVPATAAVPPVQTRRQPPQPAAGPPVVDTHRQQQNADARKKQRAEDATRQRQDIEARTQHPTVDSRKLPPPQAESPRKQQPPPAEE